ncbi:MAG: glycosyltransferase involved in cell wall biosynthesis, partial [Flavobacteriales bacterium]
QGWTKGEFEGEAGKAYYELFRKHLRTLLKTERFDLLLGVFSPHHHLKMCYELHKEFGIPYHLDFRDLWSNRIAMSGYKPSPVEKIQDAFIRKHWKKWLNAAESFSITSEPWRNYLSMLTTTPGIEVRNGFVSEEFGEVKPTTFDRFTVAYTGSIYLSQKLEIFLEGFDQFCKTHPNSQVLFLGSEVASEGGDPTARHTDLSALISAYLSPEQFVLTARKPRAEALSAMKGADVLLFCAIPELSGWYSGKFLEYLGSGTPVLVCPPDEDVLIEAITKTGAGLIANSPKEVVAALERMMKLDLPLRNEEVVKSYSREAQVRKLAKFFDSASQGREGMS